MEEELLLPHEFSHVLSLSLKSFSGSLTITEHDSAANCSTPLSCRIAHEFLFSRSFVRTYYLVLLVIIILFSCIHWSKKFSRWRSSRNRTVAKSLNVSRSPESTSSSSSTLVGSASPIVKDDDHHAENTPLLAAKSLEDHSNHQFIASVVCRIQSWLHYQPRPVPAITSPSNHLPANDTTLVIVALLAINMFYLLYHASFSAIMVFPFADRAGICFVANLPVLYILAAKSNQPLKFLTGWSYEGLNIFHRRLGEWMTILAVLHGLGMFGFWYTLLRPFHWTLGHFITNRIIFLGILALISYITIYITSVGWVRRLYYETFLGLHIFLQISALTLLYFHHPRSRVYVIISFIIWGLDRIITRNVVSLSKFVATFEIAEDGETVLVFCDIPLSKPWLGITASIRNGWQTGHHVFITIPGLGKVHQFQAHPFTIASPAPPESLLGGTWPLQLTIRAQDGFSKDLLEYAKFHQHAEVWLDGPYGADILEDLQHADRTCLIAGGSGIAVTYPLMWALNSGELGLPIMNRTIYQNGARIKPAISGWSMLPTVDRSMHLWVRQDRRHDSWLKLIPRSYTSPPSAGRPTDDTSAVDLVSVRFETRSSTGIRPDLPSELREWVERGTSASPYTKTLRHPNKRQKIAVVVSGPDSLVRDVRNGVAELVREGWNIQVHVEKFGW